MNDVARLMPIADFTETLEPMARDVCRLFNVDADEIKFYVPGTKCVSLYVWQYVAHSILLGYLAHAPKGSLPKAVKDKIRDAGVDLILSKAPPSAYDEKPGVAV